MARIVHRGGRLRAPLFGADDRELAIDLVVTHAEDGQSWDGMLFRPRAGRDSRRRRLAVLALRRSDGGKLWETAVPSGRSVVANTRPSRIGVPITPKKASPTRLSWLITSEAPPPSTRTMWFQVDPLIGT